MGRLPEQAPSDLRANNEVARCNFFYRAGEKKYKCKNAPLRVTFFTLLASYK